MVLQIVRRTLVLAVFVALLGWALASVPALAHHKEGHDKGNGKSNGTSVTEDNDTNDNDTPNNVADDGDNAHPSGKDRSVENGGSGNQGNSTSDPDDDGRGPDRTNGGADKPDGPGGEDLADQDGNNGCGNDDDFADDNEGWCGKPPAQIPLEDEAAAAVDDVVEGSTDQLCVDEMTGDAVECDELEGPAITEGTTDVCVDDETMGELAEGGCDRAPSTEGDTEQAADVLGVTFANDDSAGEEAPTTVAAAPSAEEGGLLPFTGGGLMPLVLVGAGPLLTGVVLAKERKKT